MSIKVKTVMNWMEQLAPSFLAVPDDPIGLQIGDREQEVHKVLITLDVTEAVVDEAVETGSSLIIAHHAPLFRPLQKVRLDQPIGRIVQKCMKHNISIFISHTNLDSAEGGVNDWLADRLQLQSRKVLSPVYTERLFKFVVFIPAEHKDSVTEAIFDAGAGWIGNYSHCGYETEGVGTFLPREGTNPFIGAQGEVSRVDEVKVETIVPMNKIDSVTQAMFKAHPYEEPAYDIYPLEQNGKRYGLGRVGMLPQSITLGEFAQQVKEAFDIPMLRLVGSADRKVRRVAVMGGSGGKYYPQALSARADVYITGDIDFHTAHDASAAGISLLDPGHHVEKVMKQGVAEYLQNKMNEGAHSTEIIISKQHTEPFQFV